MSALPASPPMGRFRHRRCHRARSPRPAHGRVAAETHEAPGGADPVITLLVGKLRNSASDDLALSPLRDVVSAQVAPHADEHRSQHHAERVQHRRGVSTLARGHGVPRRVGTCPLPDCADPHYDVACHRGPRWAADRPAPIIGGMPSSPPGAGLKVPSPAGAHQPSTPR